jgi:hypothetical protein
MNVSNRSNPDHRRVFAAASLALLTRIMFGGFARQCRGLADTIPATGGKKGVASARNIQDLFLKIPAKCEIQKAGTSVYSQNGQSWNFPLKSGFSRFFG